MDSPLTLYGFMFINNEWRHYYEQQYPVQEFFVRRLEAGDSGLQLRQEEDEAMVGVANAASYNQGGSLASQYCGDNAPIMFRLQPPRLLRAVSRRGRGSQLRPRPRPRHVPPDLQPAALPPAGSPQVRVESE